MYTIQDYLFLCSVIVIAMTQVFYVVRTILLDKKLRKFMKFYGELCDKVIDDVASVVGNDSDDMKMLESWKERIQEVINIF